MVLVRLPVNSRLLVVKFGGSQKLYMDFNSLGGLTPIPFALFRVSCRWNGNIIVHCLTQPGYTVNSLFSPLSVPQVM